MDNRVRLMAGTMAVGSLAAIVVQAAAFDQRIYWFSILLLGALMVICESMGEKMKSGGRSTYGIIALFGAIAALNTASAMIVALCGALNLRLARRRDDPWGLVFTGAMYAMGAWAAAAVYHVLGGSTLQFTASAALKSILPVLAAAAVFWAVNAALMAAALTWRDGVDPLLFLRRDALRLLPNFFLYALVGLCLGVIYAQNALHMDPVIDPVRNEPAVDNLGRVIYDPNSLRGSVGGYLRGLFAMLSFTALLGVAWYYSGKNIALMESYDRSIEVLVTHLERREPYLDGHAVRVADHAVLIGRKLRLPLYEIGRLRHAALLHDLGRPAIPRAVLLQPMPLSDEEFAKIRSHPLEGSIRLEEVPYLYDMAEAVRHHHEHYDGGGYVDHIAGETIPLTARIIAVADAYDAMLHRRPWREAKDRERALAELRQNSGRQFDPGIVEAFAAALEEQAGMPERAPEAGPEGPEAPAPERERKAPRERGRRTRRREELLRERREERERLEREALRALEEQAPPQEGGDAPAAGGAVEAPPPETAPPRQGGEGE